MSQYCDSAILERNWFNWLLASSVPTLEKFREVGLLWTKAVGRVLGPEGAYLRKFGEYLRDPYYPYRLHCLAFATPVFFWSVNGVVSEASAAVATTGPKIQPLPTADILSLLSDDGLYGLETPGRQQFVVVPELRSSGYVQERPEPRSWDAMCRDILLICNGVSQKYNPLDKDRENLASDAFAQVSHKIKARKLIYTPGRAPVFNLLTTTIHRCMISTLNKDNKLRNNIAQLGRDMAAGIVPTNVRSLRLTHGHPIKSY